MLSDSHAAITYLVDAYAAGHKLYPANRKVRALIDRFLYLDCGATFPALIAIVVQVLFKGQKPTDEQLAVLHERVTVLDKYLEGKKYLVGDERTLADISHYATVGFAVEGFAMDVSKHPHVSAWYKLIKSELPYDEEVNVGPLKQVRKRYEQVMAAVA